MQKHMSLYGLLLAVKTSFCTQSQISTLNKITNLVRSPQKLELGCISDLCVEVFKGKYCDTAFQKPLSNQMLFSAKEAVHLDLRTSFDDPLRALYVIDDLAVRNMALNKRISIEHNMKSKIVAFVELGQKDTHDYCPGVFNAMKRYEHRLAPFMFSLSVHPRYRKMGLGAELVKQCIIQTKAWGYNELFLEIRDSNLEAVEFYRRMINSLNQAQGSQSMIFQEIPEAISVLRKNNFYQEKHKFSVYSISLGNAKL